MRRGLDTKTPPCASRTMGTFSARGRGDRMRILLIVAALAPTIAAAQTTNCTPTYGGGMTCNTIRPPPPINFGLLGSPPDPMAAMRALEAGKVARAQREDAAVAAAIAVREARERQPPVIASQSADERPSTSALTAEQWAEAERRWGDSAMLELATRGDCKNPLVMNEYRKEPFRSAIAKLCAAP